VGLIGGTSAVRGGSSGSALTFARLVQSYVEHLSSGTTAA